MPATLDRPLFPPGPKARYPGQLLFAMSKDIIGFLKKTAADYGDISTFTIGLQRMYMLNHPDHIQQVLAVQPQKVMKDRALQMAKTILGEGLLTSEGELHKRQRRLVQPAFHRQRVASYAAVMVEKAVAAGQKWKDGETRDVNKDMMDLALLIVGKTLFGADLESYAQEIADALNTTLEVFQKRMMFPTPLWQKLPLPSTFRMNRARRNVDRLIGQMIAEHRKGGKDTGDLLSMLLMSEDSDGSGHMSDLQVRDEAATLLLAGHETTANALTYTWYLLSQNPEAEAKLHAELDNVLKGRPPVFEDIPNLPYTEKVFSESMRLLPPAWALGYESTAEVEVGDYVIPKGSVIFMSQYVMHHHPRYWDKPDQFIPERFTPEAKSSRPRFAYFPFGGGPRQCIGEPFAWMEGVLALATLAQDWAPKLVPGYKLELFPSITMRPKNGMPMTLHKRKS
jgi:cytochrome P450